MKQLYSPEQLQRLACVRAADRIPAFGSIPPSVVCLVLPALVFMEMGLLMFMVPPGLTAGKDIVETILSSGPKSGCSRRGCNLCTGCHRLPVREIRPEDGPGAAPRRHHRLDCKRRSTREFKGEARSPMPTLGYKRCLCVCQCAADDGWQCDSASVGGWNGIRSVIGFADCGRKRGGRLVLSIMATPTTTHEVM